MEGKRRQIPGIERMSQEPTTVGEPTEREPAGQTMTVYICDSCGMEMKESARTVYFNPSVDRNASGDVGEPKHLCSDCAERVFGKLSGIDGFRRRLRVMSRETKDEYLGFAVLGGIAGVAFLFWNLGWLGVVIHYIGVLISYAISLMILGLLLYGAVRILS